MLILEAILENMHSCLLETPVGLIVIEAQAEALRSVHWAELDPLLMTRSARHKRAQIDRRAGQSCAKDAAGDGDSARLGLAGSTGASVPVLKEAVAQIQAYFAGSLRRFSLALAPADRDFQRRVRAAMLEISYGEATTYGEIARHLGSSARAVGQAVGANVFPLLVPCHRVLGSGGRLHGYSGGAGVATKAQLLRHERTLPASTSRHATEEADRANGVAYLEQRA